MLYCCEAVRLYGMTIREVVRGRESAGSKKWLGETAHSSVKIPYHKLKRECAPITPGVVNSKYIRMGGWGN